MDEPTPAAQHRESSKGRYKEERGVCITSGEPVSPGNLCQRAITSCKVSLFSSPALLCHWKRVKQRQVAGEEMASYTYLRVRTLAGRLAGARREAPAAATRYRDEAQSPRRQHSPHRELGWRGAGRRGRHLLGKLGAALPIRGGCTLGSKAGEAASPYRGGAAWSLVYWTTRKR